MAVVPIAIGLILGTFVGVLGLEKRVEKLEKKLGLK
jgi:hypothetical protein